jgi:hypothetical protein
VLSPTNIDDFIAAHWSQLEMLNIPEPLFPSLKEQLEAAWLLLCVVSLLRQVEMLSSICGS